MTRRPAPAGYSGTPLPKKLGFKEGMRAALAGAPQGFRKLLEPLPPGIQFNEYGKDPLDLVILFVTDSETLLDEFRPWAARIAPAGMLWVAWPKKTSGVVTDLYEDGVRDIGLGEGLVDVKVCAIDETWSGLKFVRRLRDR